MAEILSAQLARADRLLAFIAEQRRAPALWGQHDCGHMVTHWAEDLLGLPRSHHGAYADEAGAQAFLAAEGGLTAYADRFLTGLGLSRCDGAMAGDIGLLPLPCRVLTLGLKAAGRGWFLRGGPGTIHRIPAEPVLAWRVA